MKPSHTSPSTKDFISCAHFPEELSEFKQNSASFRGIDGRSDYNPPFPPNTSTRVVEVSALREKEREST